VRATITKYLSQVQACYEQGLRKKPDLAGHVSMDFEINAGGDVNVATVKQSSLGFPETEGCIAMVIKRWKFPKPVGGTIVKVNYPFTFKPINSI
jgi:TonB family protein